MWIERVKRVCLLNVEHNISHTCLTRERKIFEMLLFNFSCIKNETNNPEIPREAGEGIASKLELDV